MSELRKSNAQQVMRQRGLASFTELYQWSIDDPCAYWQMVVDRLAIKFHEQPRTICTDNPPQWSSSWLPGAQFNIIDSCFQAEPAANAIIYNTPSGKLALISYAELAQQSTIFAANLQEAGFTIGDRIAIAMPMTVEAVVAYLGIIRAGCVVVSIADSFSAEEIATRLQVAEAKLVITQDVMLRAGKTLPMYEKLCAAESPTCVVIPYGEQLQYELRVGDLEWSAFVQSSASALVAHADGNAEMNILFSSGTTGTPKAIPWTHLTPIKCAADAHFHHDIQPGDVLCWPTNLGWMMGPWLVFAALLNRATIALYNDAPLTSAFGEFVRDAEVTMLGVVPSIVKHWRSSQCMEGIDWSRVRCFSSTGEASAADDYAYLMSLANNAPIIEYCGGTEIGGGYITSIAEHNPQPATFTTPALGSGLVIFDEDSREVESGEVFLTTPSLGYSQRLLNANHEAVYFANTPQGSDGRTLRRHGDELQRLPDGSFRALGRADDTMNLGGIKVSSAEIERVLAQHNAVRELAAIAVQSASGGPSELVIFVVLSAECVELQLRSELQQLIKSQLNPLFKISDLRIIEALPRTASNKIMRRELRKEYANG